MSMTAQSLSSLGEYEWEGEYEGEWEWEADGEGEEFLAGIASLARRAASSPALRRLGTTAARSALRGLSGGGASPLLQGLSQSLGAHEWGELEWEEEYEDEGEWEANPIRRVYPEALMAHLGHAAAQAENEAEAEAFIGAIIPLAARLLPRVAPAVMRAAPQLIRGVANVTRTLRRSPVTRPLVQAIPTIVRGTVRSMAQQVARGRPVTPQTAVRALARQTARTLSDPRACTHAVRRSRALDRRYHAATPSGAARLPAHVPMRAHPGRRAVRSTVGAGR